MRKVLLALTASITCSSLGCAGHFVVRPAKPTDPGFRYYLPKPYLVVTNMTIAADVPAAPAKAPAKTDAAKVKEGSKQKELDAAAAAPEPVNNIVTVKIIYLPDRSKPYAVTIAGAGLGTFKGGLQLTNGWMLTNVSEESDAKIAETITAVSGLITSVLPLGAKKINEGAGDARQITPYFYLFELDEEGKKLTRVDTVELDQLLKAIH